MNVYKIINKMVCLLLLFALHHAQAQEPAGVLAGTVIYIKQLESGELQVVNLNEGVEYRVNVPNGHCYGLLREGKYIAFVEEENPETLEIVRPDGTPVRTVPWDDNWWSPCTGGWRGRAQLVEIPLDCPSSPGWEPVDYTYALLDVDSGAISGPYTEVVNSCGAVRTDYVVHASYNVWGSPFPLPNYVSDDTVSISSPSLDVVVYARCISGELVENWYHVQVCMGPNETVIYDAARDENIEIPTDFPDLSYDYRLGGIPWEAFQIAWSPTGRFLAYQKFDTAHVYDVVERQYWSSILAPEGYEFVEHTEPIWSPDEQTIVFSLRSWDGDDPVTTLAAYYRETEELALFSSPRKFDLHSLRWSDDSRAIVFVMGGELSHWIVGQDVVTVLDDHVVSILAWFTD